MHLNVGDPAAWYAERHADAKVGDLVPEVCFFCFDALSLGERVVTRCLVNDNVSIEPAQRGTVKRVLSHREAGHLYVVELESGKTLTCPRAALRKRCKEE